MSDAIVDKRLALFSAETVVACSLLFLVRKSKRSCSS